MLCGLPGSGKTTLARKLEQERNAIRLCPDEWIAALLSDKKDVQEMDRLRGPVELLLWQHAQNLLTLGSTVILENGFWPKWERDKYRDTAKQLGAMIELHFLHAPVEVLWERINTRNNDPNSNSFIIRKQNLLDFSKVFEAPTEEEGKEYSFFKQYS